MIEVGRQSRFMVEIAPRCVQPVASKPATKHCRPTRISCAILLVNTIETSGSGLSGLRSAFNYTL